MHRTRRITRRQTLTLSAATAALPLVHVLIGAGQWAEALPLCRTLVRLGEKRDRTEAAGRYKLLARVLGAFGDHRARLEAHDRNAALDEVAQRVEPADRERMRAVASKPSMTSR